MKNLVNLPGSISKKEALFPIKNIILANTSVYEASDPYADYYGHVPQKAKPNSLFLFTQKFYFIEEILSFSQQIEKCLLNQINIAAAVINFQQKQYPAIRIKNFPDYSKLANVQSCFIKEGVSFTSSLHIRGEMEARINKLFVLEQVAQDIYFDLTEANKAYLFLNKCLNSEEFNELVSLIKNSSRCKLFDAVHGQMLQDGQVIDFVRVFAEGLDFTFMQDLKKEFQHAIKYADLKHS